MNLSTALPTSKWLTAWITSGHCVYDATSSSMRGYNESQNHLESRMLGNLHVRFGVGAGCNSTAYTTRPITSVAKSLVRGFQSRYASMNPEFAIPVARRQRTPGYERLRIKGSKDVSSMQTIATERLPKFAGHETFTLRSAGSRRRWMLPATGEDIFLQDDALVTLGVGKNMVRSIRHWGLVTGILEESKDVPNNRGRSIRPSALGDLFSVRAGLDPYLEEVGTLWLIHWQLAGIPDGPTTWFWVFNHLPESEFTKEKLLADLVALADQAGWKRVTDNSLRRDIDCFLRTYVSARTSRTVVLEETLDCPLAELGLIQEFGIQPRLRLRAGRTRIAAPPGLRLRTHRVLGEDCRPT